MTKNEFKELIKGPVNNLIERFGYDNCSFLLCALADIFNDYAKDEDKILRNIRISLNDFFNYNIDFENYDLEIGDKNVNKN